MSNNNLDEIITNAVSDAALPEETPETDDIDTHADEVDETPETPSESPTEVVEPTTTETPVVGATSSEVASPGAVKPVQDDFEKKFGIPAQSSSGRENRIPYSRVKKITERAVTDAKSGWTKELETSHVPVAKYQELEAVTKDYTERLTKVSEFENVMMNDAPKFLDMLSTIPAYAKIFSDLKNPDPVEAPLADTSDEMPQPDQQLTDGSSVYSLEGLKTLNAWNRAQARKEIMGEVEKRYGGLEKDYISFQATQAALPKIQAQIADARTWPQFNENEEEIVKTLQQNPQVSLERAYQHIVWPKLQAEQDKLKKEVETKSGEVKVNREAIRAEILAELKKAPKSTSLNPGISSKPVASTSTTPRTLTEIIKESVDSSGIRG